MRRGFHVGKQRLTALIKFGELLADSVLLRARAGSEELVFFRLELPLEVCQPGAKQRRNLRRRLLDELLTDQLHE